MRGVARLGGGPPFPPSSSSPDPLPPLPYLMTFSAAIWGKTGWKKALKTKAAGAADGEERTKKCKILISGENRLCCRRHCLFSLLFAEVVSPPPSLSLSRQRLRRTSANRDSGASLASLPPSLSLNAYFSILPFLPSFLLSPLPLPPPFLFPHSFDGNFI